MYDIINIIYLSWSKTETFTSAFTCKRISPSSESKKLGVCRNTIYWNTISQNPPSFSILKCKIYKPINLFFLNKLSILSQLQPKFASPVVLCLPHFSVYFSCSCPIALKKLRKWSSLIFFYRIPLIVSWTHSFYMSEWVTIV